MSLFIYFNHRHNHASAIGIIGGADGPTAVYVSTSRNSRFVHKLLSEGPWKTEGTWWSDDKNSYLKCIDNDIGITVMAYFNVNGNWNEYELDFVNHIAYLEKVENGIHVGGYDGKLKFNGTEFVIKNLDRDVFGNDKFTYIKSE